jgi:hypothetical protein
VGNNTNLTETKRGSINVQNKSPARVLFAFTEMYNWNSELGKSSVPDPVVTGSRFAAHHSRKFRYGQPVSSPTIRWDDGGGRLGLIRYLHSFVPRHFLPLLIFAKA